MAPFSFSHATASLVAALIGFCFGFVLERGGFGNARNLAAQFYLYNMRVLKVMFTAIITAMLLVYLASARWACSTSSCSTYRQPISGRASWAD